MSDRNGLDLHAFWTDVLQQNRQSLPRYFREDAEICWHCTNERFTVSEYVQANCEYPGTWSGTVERIEATGDLVITAVCVFPVDRRASFHVVSFLKLKDGRISRMDEYWADDGEAPEWRRRMHIGQPIKATETYP